MNLSKRKFILLLSLMCVFHCALMIVLNYYSIITVDEFWFAHRIYQYKSALPYRDFAPYKTVLGYYLLLPGMLVHSSILPVLINLKNAIALLNGAILFVASYWLSRFFSYQSVLLSLFFLLISEIFLSYAANIRVDLIAYWFCIFSFLCLLDKKFILAGLLIGLGFAASQKAIWYFIASNCALFLTSLLFTRNKKDIFNIVVFNITTALLIIGYLTFWSFFADKDTVITSVFYEASIMYQLDWYDHARKLFWFIITLYNPLLFLTWPYTLISLLITFKEDKTYQIRFFTIIYSFTILLALLFYKQVFPYYMQVTFPIFLILYAAFLNWLFALLNSSYDFSCVLFSRNIGKAFTIFFTLFYLTLLLYVIYFLSLPKVYLLLSTLPFALLIFIYRKSSAQTLSLPLITLTLFFMGAIYPLFIFCGKLNNINGSYQRENIAAINALLQDNSDYIAGIELIYNKNQPIPGLRHLMGPAIDYLAAPNNHLRKVMLPSLYEDPNATISSVIAALHQSRVKLYVNNYRMMALPIAIKNYLFNNFEHCWGSIYLYAPSIAGEQTTINLKFSGVYLIKGIKGTVLYLNHQPFSAGQKIYLLANTYTIALKGSHHVRLKLLPEKMEVFFSPYYQADEWQKMLV